MDANSPKYARVCDNNRDRDNDETRVLPESIVMDEILPRLPVKSLIRFQCVCKHWLSTISKDPNFAKLHLKLSSLFRPCFFLHNLNYDLGELSGSYDAFFVSPYQECISKEDLELVGWGLWDICPLLVGSCNGLVCLYHYNRFELWNPATHQHNVLPNPPGVFTTSEDYVSAYGFGYVSSLDDDYKIIFSFFGDSDEGANFHGFYVFSLRSRKWRRVRDNSREDQEKERILVELSDEGLFNEGVLYWLPRPWSSRNYITGFDLRTDEFKEYLSMDWRSGYNFEELFRLKGCLALHGRRNSDHVSEFWVLKDSDDWGTWQKLFSVHLPDIPFVCLSETGKCLVQQMTDFKLYDFSEEGLKSIEGGEFAKALDHVESLVSPFGMTKPNEEEENA